MGGTKRASGRRFDREHGVTTEALMFLGELGTERGEAYAHATHYEPVPVEEFGLLMRRVPADAVRGATFVDVGAGMGRAVLLAREYPFKQIVGVELSPHLVEIARENLARGHGFEVACRDVRLIRADARKRRMPRGDLVVFLYNPFDQEALDAVLDRIAERRNASEVWLLYHTPVHGDLVVRRGYETVATLSGAAAYRLSRPSMNDSMAPTSSACEK
ncbi:MAG TPA: class I SAM-dependent methyltransferase [Candidatus Baltobacteraceae bacterium]|jgi:SAM-dependent methyltransferase